MDTPINSDARCQCSNGTRTFQRILVAVDRSKQAHFAADAATMLGRQLGADVYFINVVSPCAMMSPAAGFLGADTGAGCLEASENLLSRYKLESGDEARTTTVLREGDAVAEIVKAAEVLAADLIIIGTHARGPICETFLGSVAHDVCRKAPCPVMTVAHPAQNLIWTRVRQGVPTVSTLPK